jgi:hypothetical protein
MYTLCFSMRTPHLIMIIYDHESDQHTRQWSCPIWGQVVMIRAEDKSTSSFAASDMYLFTGRRDQNNSVHSTNLWWRCILIRSLVNWQCLIGSEFLSSFVWVGSYYLGDSDLFGSTSPLPWKGNHTRWYKSALKRNWGGVWTMHSLGYFQRVFILVFAESKRARERWFISFIRRQTLIVTWVFGLFLSGSFANCDCSYWFSRMIAAII